MRLAFALGLSLLLACSPVRLQALPAPTSSPADMLAATVQIMVQVTGTHLPTGEQVDFEWVGSGVVYDKQGDRSRILTANHVVDAPVVGAVLETDMGPVKIDTVTMVLRTQAGEICNLVPLVLGVDDYRDVATAEADCDAGAVATIATQNPASGDRVYVAGHPLGIPVAVVTEGYVGGWIDGYLLISAAAAPGNSGGPAFVDGQVVGLLVRGSGRYSHLSLLAPLQEILIRLAQTPGL